MSRIDQALTKAAPHTTANTADAPADNPWELDGQDDPLAPAHSPAPPVRGAAHVDPPLDLARDEPEPSARETTDGAPIPSFTRAIAEKLVGGKLAPIVVEEYRRLGALMHHMQVDRGVQVLMVTSAVAGEGKTLSSTNLAMTLSGSYGRQVLLIDADLRRPSLHQVFDTVNTSGLGDILRADGGVSPSLMQVAPRLTLLTAGRPDSDPLGGLTSERMKQLLAEARQTFDWVIIDTPPVGLLTDASLMAAMVDIALLVVRAESTPCDLVQRAADAIGRHRIAGVVLNRVSSPTHFGARGYADYYGSYTKPREI